MIETAQDYHIAKVQQLRLRITLRNINSGLQLDDKPDPLWEMHHKEIAQELAQLDREIADYVKRVLAHEKQ